MLSSGSFFVQGGRERYPCCFFFHGVFLFSPSTDQIRLGIAALFFFWWCFWFFFFFFFVWCFFGLGCGFWCFFFFFLVGWLWGFLVCFFWFFSSFLPLSPPREVGKMINRVSFLLFRCFKPSRDSFSTHSRPFLLFPLMPYSDQKPPGDFFFKAPPFFLPFPLWLTA